MKFSTAALSTAAIVIVACSTLLVHARAYTNKGKATWYKQGNEAGSCGKWHKDSDHVVALPSYMANGQNCGRRLTIHHNGKQIQAVVADECPGCASNQIDLSRGAFGSLAPYSEGDIAIQWWFTD